jgi:hypothetical protein
MVRTSTIRACAFAAFRRSPSAGTTGSSLHHARGDLVAISKIWLQQLIAFARIVDRPNLCRHSTDAPDLRPRGSAKIHYADTFFVDKTAGTSKDKDKNDVVLSGMKMNRLLARSSNYTARGRLRRRRRRRQNAIQRR